jgi:hypothetical protein
VTRAFQLSNEAVPQANSAKPRFSVNSAEVRVSKALREPGAFLAAAFSG